MAADKILSIARHPREFKGEREAAPKASPAVDAVLGHVSRRLHLLHEALASGVAPDIETMLAAEALALCEAVDDVRALLAAGGA
jgi:hypothetical protein